MATQDGDFVTAEGLAKAISETVGMTRGGAAQYAYWKSPTKKDDGDKTDVPMTVSSFATNAPIQQDGSGFVFSLGGFYQFDYEAKVDDQYYSVGGTGMNVIVLAYVSIDGQTKSSAQETMNVYRNEGNPVTLSGSCEVFVQAGQKVELDVSFSERTGLSYCTYYPILDSASLTMKLT